LGKTPPQLVEDLKTKQAELLEAKERIEDLKQERLRLEQELHQLKAQVEREQKEYSGIQLEVERLGQECQRLTEDLEREREERLGAQRRAEQQEQERARLEREFLSLRTELDSNRRSPTRDRAKESEPGHFWWRRPVLAVGLLFGALLMWLTPLAVALYLVTP